jgi:hypothetical protein
VALGESLRLDVAEGWSAHADSVLEAGVYPEAQRNTQAALEMIIVAADLADVADRAAATRAVASLSRYVSLDSAQAWFADRPVWNAGWLLGAWQAQRGDTSVAGRWIRVLGTLPEGGTSEDYRGALQADIEARLAVRRWDPDAAVSLERTAMKLWTIHADREVEFAPSPMVRLTLALLLRQAGQSVEATALLSSLVLPTTWMGFMTARADFELGEMAAERGDAAAARLHYGRALALWGTGGPPVAERAQRARAQMEALRTR